MTNNADRLYRFHWLDGSTNEGKGKDAADAFTRLGFGAGAVPALDYHEILKRKEGICPTLKDKNCSAS